MLTFERLVMYSMYVWWAGKGPLRQLSSPCSTRPFFFGNHMTWFFKSQSDSALHACQPSANIFKAVDDDALRIARYQNRVSLCCRVKVCR
jgi:hypothetical protein